MAEGNLNESFPIGSSAYPGYYCVPAVERFFHETAVRATGVENWKEVLLVAIDTVIRKSGCDRSANEGYLHILMQQQVEALGWQIHTVEV